MNKLSEKVKFLSSKDYSFLLGGMHFTSDDGFQNMFAYQPTFNTIKHKNMSTEFLICWKSKGVYNSKVIALNSDFLPNIEYLKKLGYNLIILL